MRDWKKEIAEHLSHVQLPRATKEEVIAELASHMEETERESQQKEAGTPELSRRTWRRLGRAIYRAKEKDMNRRDALWIPIFVNLLLTSALINICDRLADVDLAIYRAHPIPLTPQPWVLALTISGAAAAFLARGSQASPRQRIIAALVPCVIWSAVPFFLELIFLCFPETFPGIPVRSLALSSVWFFVFPGLALLLGAAPFLRTSGVKAQVE